MLLFLPQCTKFGNYGNHVQMDKKVCWGQNKSLQLSSLIDKNTVVKCSMTQKMLAIANNLEGYLKSN